ncbi:MULTISPECIES: hypothetical protein [Microbacteriaceae]|uniref:hypothetical protein n=1 Tax=Orlajensenia leifsoniae TaxID=2561933 RepID=UPI000AA9BFAD|nr:MULTISPECIES: hypothetical protein [Leifsonia]
MEIDDGDDPRFVSPEPCPQCGDAMNGGVIGGDDIGMLISLRCLGCGYTALVDPFV